MAGKSKKKEFRVSVSFSETDYRFLTNHSEKLGCSRSLVLAACWHAVMGDVDQVCDAQYDFDNRERPMRRNTDELRGRLSVALMVARGNVSGCENETMDMFPVSLDDDG